MSATSGLAATDAYVADRVAPALRPIAAGAVELLREEMPNATEAIKWSRPVWQSSKRLVAFVLGCKGYVSVGFTLDPTLPDPHGMLEGTGSTMRHVKLTSFGEPERAALRHYVRLALSADA